MPTRARLLERFLILDTVKRVATSLQPVFNYNLVIYLYKEIYIYFGVFAHRYLIDTWYVVKKR